ncbi:zinc-binding alcohol dehydrogenase [Curtobacterium pusillum]|uniref:zinc-dependent alcohol dehydrogenase n=1 Tax=Curtobacterium pusillum TaxID=69373 RepID=UPI0011A1F437|nr:zinc-binding alcohol dehydrogenase [Curtobacterium pusillum]
MTAVLRFAAPRRVEIVDLPSAELHPGEVRVRTLVTGISAGTEMTAYRGTNPYLTSEWDPDVRLFRAADEQRPPAYPLDGWGYSEVGEVVEIAPFEDGTLPDGAPAVGDVVWGIWGHRAEGVLPVDKLLGHTLPAGLDPLSGSFVRVGAIALNGVLAADLGVGSTVVVFGQGVIGLLATRLAVLNGATVIAVDGIASRREHALAMGAAHALEPGAELALRVRELTDGAGADVAIELSGNYHALHDAIRTVGVDGTVVASGFYQGAAQPVRLGEEFHHNRVQVLASQIGAAPARLRARWDVPRLQRAVVDAMAKGRLDPRPLVSHRYPLAKAATAYAMLDTDPSAALQVVLELP